MTWRKHTSRLGFAHLIDNILHFLYFICWLQVFHILSEYQWQFIKMAASNTGHGSEGLAQLKSSWYWWPELPPHHSTFGCDCYGGTNYHCSQNYQVSLCMKCIESNLYISSQWFMNPRINFSYCSTHLQVWYNSKDAGCLHWPGSPTPVQVE